MDGKSGGIAQGVCPFLSIVQVLRWRRWRTQEVTSHMQTNPIEFFKKKNVCVCIIYAVHWSLVWVVIDLGVCMMYDMSSGSSGGGGTTGLWRIGWLEGVLTVPPWWFSGVQGYFWLMISISGLISWRLCVLDARYGIDVVFTDRVEVYGPPLVLCYDFSWLRLNIQCTARRVVSKI